jgi:O-antigen ligase
VSRFSLAALSTAADASLETISSVELHWAIMRLETQTCLDKRLSVLSCYVKFLPAPGLLGVHAYLVGFALPSPWDFPLIILAISGVLAVNACLAPPVLLYTPLARSVFIFTAITGLQCVFSCDWRHSIRLSATLVPAALVFLLVARGSANMYEVRRLYCTLSVVAGGLAFALLGTAMASDERSPTLWVAQLGNPLLLVPNDCLLLAILTPLAFALLQRNGSQLRRMLAFLTLTASGAAIVFYQSRTALITLGCTLTYAAMLLRLRRGLVWTGVAVSLSLLVDAALGFPLTTKFAQFGEARLSLWWIAWSMFWDAPLVGHGPHTFGLLYRSYLHQTVLPEWLPRDAHSNVPWAHNLYLELLAEQGIVGFLSFMLLLADGMTVAWKTQRTATPETRPFIVGIFAGLVGLCVAAIFELTLLRQWVVILFLLFFGLISQLASLPHQSRDPPAERVLPMLSLPQEPN